MCLVHGMEWHMTLTCQWRDANINVHNGDEMVQTGANHFYCSLCVMNKDRN